MTRNAARSRQAIFNAAAAEFAASGYAGASVDRIADRAGLNKAMIYYHFADKSALYHEVVCDIFRTLAERINRIAAQPAPPAAKIDAAIDSLAAMASSRPYFPAMMAREIAEGGIHLDEDMVGGMIGVFQGVMRLLAEGRARGEFRALNPALMYFTIIAPLVFFLASGSVRARLKRRLAAGDRHSAALARRIPDSLEAMLDHHKTAIRLMLGAGGSSPAAGPERRGRNRRPPAGARAATPPATRRRRHAPKTVRPGDHA